MFKLVSSWKKRQIWLRMKKKTDAGTPVKKGPQLVTDYREAFKLGNTSSRTIPNANKWSTLSHFEV